jgi:hypothetical protein
MTENTHCKSDILRGAQNGSALRRGEVQRCEGSRQE